MGDYFWNFGGGVDFFYRSLILFFLYSGFVQALPTVGVSSVRGATSTVYSVSSTGGTSPLLTAPVGSTVINNGITSNASGYTSNALLSGSVKSAAVNWGVSAAALALSATKFAANPLFSVGILAGTALYNYMQQSNVSVNSAGNFTQLSSGYYWSNNNGYHTGATPLLSCQGNLNAASLSTVSATYNIVPVGSYCTLVNKLTGASGGNIGQYSGPVAYSTPTYFPISQSDVSTLLTNNPPLDKSASLAQLHNFTNDQYYQNGVLVDPVADAPTITAPASITDSPRTTVNPDNSISKSTDTTSCTQASTTSISCTVATTITNTSPTGTVVSTTINNPPPDTPATPNQSPQKTDCELFPDNVGCSKYGTPDPKEIIPVESVSLSNAYTSWGAGSCPAAVSLPHGMTFKYDSMCSALVLLKPILIAMGLLISMFIVSGGVKE